jgi:hypothetical protein
MGIGRADGKIQSGVKPPQSKKEGSGISRGDAEVRRVGDRVSQLSKTFCGHEGVLECSGLAELGMGIERGDGKIQSGVKPPQSKKEGSGISRGEAEARRVGDRVSQLSKTFCGHEGVLECSGLAELGMGIERGDGKIQSGVKPPQSKKEGSGSSRGDAEVRRVGDRVSQLPKTFWGHEGVLECSGWTELGMGIERGDGKIQSGVKPPQSKKEGSGSSRGDAEVRRVGDRVSQLSKMFCGHEGVLECSGLTELGMGIERFEGENPKRCQATAVQERRIRNLTRRRGVRKGGGRAWLGGGRSAAGGGASAAGGVFRGPGAREFPGYRRGDKCRPGVGPSGRHF